MKDPKRRRPAIMLTCLVLVILLPIIYYGLYFILQGPRPATPQFIAHRGGRAHNPENTPAAFRHAIDLGVDWLEFDVQMTKDDVLVVIHDETVDRTTNGTGRVADLTLEEIRALDAGNGQNVPTFAEVLTLAKEVDKNIMPELKSPHLYPGIEAKLIDAVTEADYVGKTLIQSFNLDSLETVHNLNPEIKVGPLYRLWHFDLGSPQPADTKVVCPMAEMVVLYPWMLRQARSEGRQAYVWFGIIEHPLTQRLVLAFGADGLMVDNTESLAEILKR